MHRRRVSRILVAAAACSVVGSMSAPAVAYDVEVNAQTAAQGYQLRNAWGAPLLSRRRFVQTLGLRVTGLGDADGQQDGPWVSFRMRMRLDADFAIDGSEVDPTGSPEAYVPGLQRAPMDLMYGYFDIRNLAGGVLSAKIGRQFVIDSLGWWSFDGALVRAELPVHLAIEGYGGLEQRAGFPLSSSRFERDGVWRGDRTSLDAATYPGFLDAGLAPAWGVTAESFALPVVHGRIGYRKVWNTGEVATNPLPEGRTAIPPTTAGWRTSQERVGASADALVDDIGALRTGAIYDLHRAGVTSWYGSLDAFLTTDLTAGVDVDRMEPSFDGDSIWSFFATEPTTTLLARADLGLTKDLRVAVAGGSRWVDLTTSGAEHRDAPDVAVDGLGRASVRYDLGKGNIGLGGMLDAGQRGARRGMDVFADRWVERRFSVSGRLSLYDWRDALREDRSATSFGYVLGGGYRVGHETTARVEWEHDMNELVGQRYRILASLEILVNP